MVGQNKKNVARSRLVKEIEDRLDEKFSKRSENQFQHLKESLKEEILAELKEYIDTLLLEDENVETQPESNHRSS